MQIFGFRRLGFPCCRHFQHLRTRSVEFRDRDLFLGFRVCGLVFFGAPFSGSVAFGIEQSGFKSLRLGASVEARTDDAGRCSLET